MIEKIKLKKLELRFSFAFDIPYNVMRYVFWGDIWNNNTSWDTKVRIQTSLRKATVECFLLGKKMKS